MLGSCSTKGKTGRRPPRLPALRSADQSGASGRAGVVPCSGGPPRARAAPSWLPAEDCPPTLDDRLRRPPPAGALHPNRHARTHAHTHTHTHVRSHSSTRPQTVTDIQDRARRHILRWRRTRPRPACPALHPSRPPPGHRRRLRRHPHRCTCAQRRLPILTMANGGPMYDAAASPNHTLSRAPGAR